MTPTVWRDHAKMQGGASRAVSTKTHGGARTEPDGRSVSTTSGSMPTNELSEGDSAIKLAAHCHSA